MSLSLFIIIIISINPLGTVWCKLFYIETFPQIANTLNAITGVKIKYYSYHFFILVQLNVNFKIKMQTFFSHLELLISISLLF